ncbi:MAG: MFS transporter [Nitrososphaerota archaeon]|nr:MFS transporter [Nitrososphaerota archaeon]
MVHQSPFRMLVSSKYRGTLLAALFSYMSFGLLFQIFPPFLRSLQSEFGIDHATASLVMTAMLLPMAFTAIPAGFFADRQGARRTGVLGLSIMAVGGAITILSPGFTSVVGGRVVSGLGSALLLVSILKLLMDEIPRTKQGLAFGLFVSGLPVGTGISFDLLAPFGKELGWRGETGIATAVVIAALVVYSLVAKPRTGARAVSSSSIAPVLRNGAMLRLIVTVVLGYTAIIGFTTWAPSTLVSYAHIPIWLASVIASILLLIDIPLGPFWGSLSDRLGRRKLFVVLAFVIYAMASLFVPFAATSPSWLVAPALILVIGAMGTGCSMFFPAALTIPGNIASPEGAGTAYGLFFTAQIIGMLVGPLLIGYSLDVASPFAGFLTVSIITFVGLLASVMIRSK